jgi:hypothetical protein
MVSDVIEKHRYDIIGLHALLVTTNSSIFRMMRYSVISLLSTDFHVFTRRISDRSSLPYMTRKVRDLRLAMQNNLSSMKGAMVCLTLYLQPQKQIAA